MGEVTLGENIGKIFDCWTKLSVLLAGSEAKDTIWVDQDEGFVDEGGLAPGC